MTIDTNQFWNLISESQLVPVDQVQTLFSEFGSDAQDKTAKGLAKWLVKKRAISRYQATIILAGHSGPFRMGKYTLVSRIEKGPMKGQFSAQDSRSKYPVLLQFLPGSQTEHLKQWNRIESIADEISTIRHPSVAETFESVVLPNHRFVVSELPTGEPLCEKIPRKARLPWKIACGLIAQVARGLDQFRKADIIHGSVSPRTIWITEKGRVQLRRDPFPDLDFQLPDKELNGNESYLDYLAPEQFDSATLQSADEPHPSPTGGTAASDIYSLGCTLFRSIAGKTPFPELDPEKKKSDHRNSPPPDLKRLELPSELVALLKKMLAKDPAERPEANEVFNLLALHSGKANELKSQNFADSPARLKFRESLTAFAPDLENEIVASAPIIETGTTQAAREDAAPSIQPSDSDFASQASSPDRSSRIEAARLAAERRKKNRWKMPAAIAASLLALAGIVGGAAYYANQTTASKVETNNTKPDDSEISEGPDSGASATGSATTTTAVDGNTTTPSIQPVLSQSLIDDDRETLWETPTSGPKVDFSFLPLSPKMLLSVRPSDFFLQPEGERILQSLGPDFSSRLEQLKSQSGLDFEQIQQLIISLHSNDAFEYEPYFIVTTTTPVPHEAMLERWNGPAAKTLDNQQVIYESQDGLTAFYFLPEPETDNEDPATVQTEPDEKPNIRFAFGSKELVQQVALTQGGNILSGSLLQLAQRTDNDRHFNLLFLRNGLFNDEGQKLMGDKMSVFNRELRVMIPDEVRGGLVSFHIDSGNYFELMLDKTLSMKSRDLKQIMQDETRNRRDMLMRFVSKIPPNPYWDQVRFRYASMLNDFNRNLRWNVENGEVVANCWLSPMAAHNLLAASELAISFASGGSPSATAATTGPKTLDELLAMKRDLNIANPPDLNVLLADLQTEVLDDIGKIPFTFNIRLIGSDLEADGITKNQRPGELVIEQKSLGEILTAIMVGANPDKDISGAKDPNCKLIWVVADDPENPGQQAILITTRKAAAQKSYSLPAAFQTE